MNLAYLCPVACLCFSAISSVHADLPQPTLKATLRAVDLKIGEIADVKLADGGVAKVKLLDLQEKVDTMSAAVREARC